MTEQLKPCPFCGGTANIAKGQIEFWAYCPHCGAQTELYETEQEVAKAWNARPIENELEAENARLHDALDTIVGLFEINGGFWAVAEKMHETAKRALEK